jgi:hypothetical protein
VKPEEWDAFHELILVDELARCGSGGVISAILTGLAVGLPPILHFGSQVWISFSLSISISLFSSKEEEREWILFLFYFDLIGLTIERELLLLTN